MTTNATKNTLIVLVMMLFMLGGYYLVSNSSSYAEVQSGSYPNSNATWEYDDETQILQVNGTGDLWYQRPSEISDLYETYIVKKIVIGEGITSLGNLCNSVSNVVEIVLPETLPSIGDCAFQHCTNLKTIMLPEGVTSIGDYAFSGCSKLESLVLPGGVESIGVGAFSESPKLEEIVVPDTVSSIGMHAFYACSALKSVNVPNGVKIIREMTFKGCSKLESLWIPDSVLTVKGDAFINCTSLKTLRLPTNLNSISNLSFNGCSSLEEIILPNNLESLDERAFKNCTTLKRITIPATITAIEKETFYGCTALEEVTISGAVTSIGEYAFYHCNSLAEITLPQEVVTIGQCAFAGCKDLKKIVIPTGVTTIENCTFSGCESLADIMFPDALKTIGQKAFLGCAMEEVTIPDSVTSMPGGNGTAGSFRECSNLRKVKLSNSLSRFNLGTFSGCNKLKEIEIPASVEHLDEGLSPDGHKHLKRIVFKSAQAPEGFENFEYAGAITLTSPHFRICVPNDGTGYEFTQTLATMSRNIVRCSSSERNQLTVTNGVVDQDFEELGTDRYFAGEPVHIEPNVPEGKAFGYWEVVKGNVPDLDVTSREADIVMPAEEVEIKAVLFDKQSIQIEGGTASCADCFPGETVTISADIPGGKMFKRWVVEEGTISDLDTTKAQTTFTMPNESVKLKAEFADKHTVTINGGTADPDFCGSGETVTITADVPEGKAFDSWSVTSGTIELADATATSTSFVMPEEDVKIEAVLVNAHLVSISGGRINGGEKGASAMIPVGQAVTITAIAPTGKNFDRWNLVSGTAEGMDQTQAITSFTMPDEAVEVSAAFKNASSSGEDTLAPVVTDIRVQNPSVSKPGILNVELDVIEEDSGTNSIVLWADFEDGDANHALSGYPIEEKTYYSGIVHMRIRVDTAARSGKFTISGISISDHNNNTRYCRVVNQSDIWYLAFDDDYTGDYDYVLSKSPEFTVYYGFDISVDSAFSNPNLISRLEGMDDDGVARIRIDSDGILKKEVLDAIKGTNKILVLYKDAYQWIICGNMITGNTKDIDVNLSIEKMSGRDFGSSRDIVELFFAANGQLPVESEIRLKSDYLYGLYGITGDLFLYYFNNGNLSRENTEFDLVFDGTDKWCNFTITHNSKFFVSGVKLSKTASVPKGNTFIYNGIARTGVASGTGYTLSGTTSATRAGNYTAVATLKAGYVWKDGSSSVRKITWRINKATNTLTAKAKTATVKLKAVKKKTQKVKRTKVIYIAKNKGAVTYKKVSGNKKITINKKTGLVTVKKGLKKGTYKIKTKVMAAGDANHKALTKKVTFRIKIK